MTSVAVDPKTGLFDGTMESAAVHDDRRMDKE